MARRIRTTEPSGNGSVGAGRRNGRPVFALRLVAVGALTLAASLACAPRVTPPDPWKGKPTPAETGATGSGTPVAAATPAAPEWTPPGQPTPAPLDPCGSVAEGPAPVGKLHTIRFLDVGQGDGALVTTASGKSILIDAGDRDPKAKIVADLKGAGVDKLDLLMASHPHLDHIGAMRMIVDTFPVRLYVDPGTSHDTDTYRDLLLAVEARKIPYQVLRAGKLIRIGDEATLSVLSPGENLISSARSSENANSLVVRLSIGSVDVLFMGDAEPETLNSLLHSRILSGSSIEVLKVAHHGSRYGTSPEFLAEVRPKVAVISAGFRNDYRHPHGETLEALAHDCIRTYRTDRDGTVTMTTDGTGFRFVTERGTTPSDARPMSAPANGGDAHGAADNGHVYATKKGKTYHVAGCFHLASAEDAIEFSSADEAKSAGLRSASGCRVVVRNGAVGQGQKPTAGVKAAVKGPVVASSRGKVYHPAGCPHIAKIKEENRVEYSSAEEAEASGLRAGSGCTGTGAGP